MKNLDYIKLVLGSVSTNTYILYNKQTKECIIIDPADEAQKIIETKTSGYTSYTWTL